MRRLMAIMFLLAGCGGAQVISDPQSGTLTLFSGTAKAELEGVFERADGLVRFETTTVIDDAGTAALAVRFADADGSTVAARTLGAVLPSGWEAGTPARSAAPLALAAAEALRRAQLPTEAMAARDALVGAAAGLVDDDAPFAGAAPAGRLQTANVDSYSKLVNLFYKPFAPYGEHSATRTKTFDNGVLIAVEDHCNHGDCPGATTMTKRFSCASPVVTTLSLLPAPSECSTSYNVTSTPYGHNCNDDSWLQIRRVALAWSTLSSDGGDCANSSTHSFAPKCCPSSTTDQSCRGAN